MTDILPVAEAVFGTDMSLIIPQAIPVYDPINANPLKELPLSDQHLLNFIEYNLDHSVVLQGYLDRLVCCMKDGHTSVSLFKRTHSLAAMQRRAHESLERQMAERDLTRRKDTTNQPTEDQLPMKKRKLNTEMES